MAERKVFTLPERASAVGECRLIDLPRIHDPRGNLTFLESGIHAPFQIERVYYLYDVPGGETRGGHAHKELQQFIIAAAGSFDVVLDDGRERQRYHLNRSYFGLYLPRMIWRELDNFSSSSVCLVLASAHYAEEDYIRDYAEYCRIVDSLPR
jgi:dTDP-4-dehydrorhamnose 3,5-epimerase-like enzyme